MVQLAKAFQANGLTLLVLIQQGLYDANGNLFTSESAAYNAGVTAGSTIAAALAPYGVTDIEMPATAEKVWRTMHQMIVA